MGVFPSCAVNVKRVSLLMHSFPLLGRYCRCVSSYSCEEIIVVDECIPVIVNILIMSVPRVVKILLMSVPSVVKILLMSVPSVVKILLISVPRDVKILLMSVPSVVRL